MQKVLQENAELGARLIDLALSADAADDSDGWDREESRRRQTELQREVCMSPCVSFVSARCRLLG